MLCALTFLIQTSQRLDLFQFQLINSRALSPIHEFLDILEYYRSNVYARSPSLSILKWHNSEIVKTDYFRNLPVATLLNIVETSRSVAQSVARSEFHSRDFAFIRNDTIQRELLTSKDLRVETFRGLGAKELQSESMNQLCVDGNANQILKSSEISTMNNNF